MADISLSSTQGMRTNVPRHVGIILDGNRRWAKARNKPSFEGHKKGADNLRKISLGLFDRGVATVSAYVFSTENWKRSEEEVGFLMKLVVKALIDHLKEYEAAGVRIIVVGDKDGLPEKVQQAIDKAESATKMASTGTLALCLNYGGKAEIVAAAKKIAQEKLQPNDIDETVFESHMQSSNLPDIDLLVRTSGEKRLSGYMLWKAAYAELYFTDTLWPDINLGEFDTIIETYMARERRFGC